MSFSSLIFSQIVHPAITQLTERPQIDGVEVTQGIQYYNSDRHLTDSEDWGENNSVRLVAFKPAWVRVYLRRYRKEEFLNVVGEVVLERRNLIGNYMPVLTLKPAFPKADAELEIDYATERGFLSSSLNFILPSNALYGYMRIKVSVWPNSHPTLVSTRVENLNFTLHQTLKLRGIFVNYKGRNVDDTSDLDLPAPSLNDLQDTAALALTVNPLDSTGIFSSAGSLPWTIPLTGAADDGKCSKEWLALLAALMAVKDHDGNRPDVFYYGLLPQAMPILNVTGCENGVLSAGLAGWQGTMMHEIGHAAGLQHAPCGVSPADPAFPAYEPYDTAENRKACIGEYGLNVNDGNIIPPADYHDYMGYCDNPWLSLYHHAKLIRNAKFHPRSIGTTVLRKPEPANPWIWSSGDSPDSSSSAKYGNPRFVKPQPLISIIGVINERCEIEVHHVMRVTAFPEQTRSRRTSMKAELLDEENRPLARVGVFVLSAQASCFEGRPDGESAGCNCPAVFQALLPNVAPGKRLRIVREDENKELREMWSLSAPPQEPIISSFEISVRNARGYAQWQADNNGRAIEFSLQFSVDRGRSWNSLAIALKGSEHHFELTALPSGAMLFALLAHDGFFSTRRTSQPIELPMRAPNVSIQHPQNGDVLLATQPMRLWGAVSTCTGDRIKDRACRWLLDGEEIGCSLEQWISTPDPGEHLCTLIVEDETGRVETSVTFQSLGPDVHDPHARGSRTKDFCDNTE